MNFRLSMQKDPDEGTKDEEEKQPVHTGWYQNEEGDWYLYDENGTLQTGWILQGTTWYYLDGANQEKPGLMIADQILEINGKYYSFDNSGAMQTGWILKKEGWYYAQTDGAFVNGWNNINGAWYYLDANNEEHRDLMVAGQQKEIDGNTYFFGEKRSHEKWLATVSGRLVLCNAGWSQGVWLEEH